MRACLHLQILAQEFDITLVIVTHRPGVREGDIPEDIRRLCRRVGFFAGHTAAPLPFGRLTLRNSQLRMLARMMDPLPPEFRRSTADLRDRISRFAAQGTYDAIHVFHLAMAPYMSSIVAAVGRPPLLTLDLDDVESQATERVLATFGASNGFQWRVMQRLEVLKYRWLERRYLRQVDQVYVCSKLDQKNISKRFTTPRVLVIPNGVRIPPPPPDPGDREHHVLLFVGMMNYFPNEDAIIYFCDEILPTIRSSASKPVRVMVVGGNPPERVLALESTSNIWVTGFVPSLAEYYAEADIVIAPLRLGGGTRIKILEAFSYGRAVVATSVGAEGLEVCHGVNVLLADDPSAFAHCCVALLNDPEERRRLAANALDLLNAKYSHSAIGTALIRAYGNPLHV